MLLIVDILKFPFMDQSLYLILMQSVRPAINATLDINLLVILHVCVNWMAYGVEENPLVNVRNS